MDRDEITRRLRDGGRIEVYHETVRSVDANHALILTPTGLSRLRIDGVEVSPLDVEFAIEQLKNLYANSLRDSQEQP